MTSSDDNKKLENIRSVNGCLAMLARDEDLQDDLKLPILKLAIDHWSGVHRMPPEMYLKKLEKDLRVQSVYPKLKMLQSVCNAVPMKLPLDHMLEGKSELDSSALTRAFGVDFCVKHGLVQPPQTTTSLSSMNVEKPQQQQGSKVPSSSSSSSAPSQSSPLPSPEERIDAFLNGNTTTTTNNSTNYPPVIDTWRVFKDAMKNAEWGTIFLQVFQQQAMAFVACVLLAYFLGYLTLDQIISRFSFFKSS